MVTLVRMAASLAHDKSIEKVTAISRPTAYGLLRDYTEKLTGTLTGRGPFSAALGQMDPP